MQIDVFVPLGAQNASPGFVRTLGPAIEERGFGGVWVPEHVVLFDDYDSDYPYTDDGRMPGTGDMGLLDPLIALTYLAAVTDRIRLGTGICILPQRNPIYTARQVADIDVLSGGRLDLGIGVGWLREEFDALNVPWERRGRRTDEYLEILRSLWTEESTSYEGETFTIPADPPARLYPKPVQDPVPVHVGGESDAAMRRAARHGQGWFTFNRPADGLDEPLARLDRHLAEAGRTRDDGFEVTLSPYLHPVGPAELEAYAAAGVDRLIVVALARDADGLRRQLDGLATAVLEPANALAG